MLSTFGLRLRYVQSQNLHDSICITNIQFSSLQHLQHLQLYFWSCILLLSTKTFNLSTSVCSLCHTCNNFTPSIILLFYPMIHKISHKQQTNYMQTF